MALTIIHLCEGFPVRLNCLECKLFKISFSRINYRKMITSYIYNSVKYNYTFSFRKSYKNVIKIVVSTFTSTTKSRKCSKFCCHMVLTYTLNWDSYCCLWKLTKNPQINSTTKVQGFITMHIHVYIPLSFSMSSLPVVSSNLLTCFKCFCFQKLPIQSACIKKIQ